MNNAKRIILRIGGIMCCVFCFIWLIVGCVYTALAFDTALMEKMADGTANTSADAFKTIFLSVGIMFFIGFIFAILCAIVSLKGINSDSKKQMVLIIIFGALSLVEVPIVGAIFGLIAISKKNNTQNAVIE